ncbi:carboxylesterase/lipase family protein [Weizmannia acidilactici]|uniref:carboxylesterase/lipase family protein n=1 Tax=Weizmannia acidilactici TaxID=2607726 RepID=UPI00124C445B|nr:carboxylesterase/lipase family protein [Weizmannia acidilactici]GER75051.1 carboxylesterase [Weizmannia acidilactici]
MPAPIIETVYGKVQGYEKNGVQIWKGIPYAKPPVGPLRFLPPQPPKPWTGVKDCTQFGPIPWQPSVELMNFLDNPNENMSEDCLYLNIWSPDADGGRRPVMVWIHGGAFANGAGSSPSYDGAAFAKNGDVVVVTINYRLGALGFLHLAEIGGEDYRTSGNCGILDQIAALKWVKENIAAFGGDPGRVTIFGESAGAMSVATLLAAPSTKGLFHQAILESGAANFVATPERATKNALRILDALGLEKAEISKLQEIPAKQLAEAVNSLPFMSLLPVIDGVVLPKHPEAAFKEGCAKDIPVLIGTNKDEYRLFTAFDPVWQKQDPQETAAVFQKTFAKYWDTLSAMITNPSPFNQELYDRIMTYFVFTGPALRLADTQASLREQVWMYRFDWESTAYGGMLRSCHTLEIPFVWNTLQQPGTKKLTGESLGRQALADRMHLAWIAFAKTGNPNNRLLPDWPAYDTGTRATMIFDRICKAVNDPHSKERAVWSSVRYLESEEQVRP